MELWIWSDTYCSELVLLVTCPYSVQLMSTGHILHAVIYIFLLLHPPCSSFPSPCCGSTWTRAASVLSVGVCSGRNDGLCVWRVRTAWRGRRAVVAVVVVGGIAALAPCILGLGVRAFVGTFPRLSRIASSPSTMTAAGARGRVWLGNFIWSVIPRGKGDCVRSWNPLWSLKAAGCIQFNYRKKVQKCDFHMRRGWLLAAIM